MLLRSILRLASEEFLVLAAINSHACSKKIRVVALTNSRASSEKICADDQFALTPNKFIYLLWPIFALFWVLVLARTCSGKISCDCSGQFPSLLCANSCMSSDQSSSL